jgi:hypothetical protein
MDMKREPVMGIIPMPTPEPNQSAIKLLKDVLDEIMSGDVTRVAVVAVRRDGDVSTGFSGGSEGYHQLVSGIAYLSYRVQAGI